MRNTGFLTFRFLIVLSLFLFACRLTVPTSEERTPAPTSTRASIPQTSPEVQVSPEVLTTTRPVATTPPVPQDETPPETPPPPGEPSQAVLEACGSEAQAAALNPQGEQDWDSNPFMLCYQLSLALQSGPGYTGSARITLTNLTGSPLDELVFRLYPNSREIYGGQLQVTSARVAGETVEPEVELPDETALRLPLASSLPVGADLVVELEFEGRTAEDFGGDLVYGVFNYSNEAELITLANWYPILAEWEQGAWQVEPVSAMGDAVVSEAALYRVEIQAPEGWQVASTGIALEEETGAEGRQISVASGPVRDFMLVAGPRLVERQAEIDGILVRHWGLPGGEDRWDGALQVALDSLELFNSRFGPYPYQELDIVAAPLRLASGVEYPGLVLIEQAEYTARTTIFLDITISHEVAHQWWYGVVGNDVLENPWQDEALATYSSLLYQEAYQPEAFEGTLEVYRERVERVEGGPMDGPIFQPVEAFRANPSGYSTVVYLKGALFFMELREEIGEQAFFNALQSYYDSFRFRLAEPEALLGAFESACNCELDQFFAAW